MDWFTPHNKSGVGLSDFKKGQGPARLDKQILMGFSEVFAYKDFNESKVKNCIEELTDRRTSNPVLKEITVFDHKFLSHVYDSEKPHLDTLQAEGSDNGAGFGNNNKFKKRIVVNGEDGSKLRFYHDILYDKNNHSDEGGQNKVQSRLIFDINNEETIRNLGLDIIYKSKKNSFSTYLWNEPRYMIADTLLLEFINNFWQAFFLVSERMRYTYVHDLWPKQKVGRNKYKLVRINDSTIRSLYIKWYKKLFGSQRFYGLDFVSTIMNDKRHVDNINRFKKYLKRLERKTVLQYCKTEDIKESFKTITKSQQNARGIINFYDAAIKKEYQNIMDPIYMQVREKYNDITESATAYSLP